MNLPNKITLVRVFLIPFFVVFYLFKGVWGGFAHIAAMIYIIASITDLIDGKIARKYNLVTNFGKFADPLADKMLVGAALILLTEAGLIPGWVVILLISREFIISGFRLIAVEKGVVLAASKIAKFKTASQMVMTIVYLFNIEGCPFLHIFGLVFIGISIVLTIWSLVDYLVKNWSVMKDEV